jgi:hypothetical protein
MGGTSGSRNTALTPTSGTKVRIITINTHTLDLTTDPEIVYIYFGTGAAYTTNPEKALVAVRHGAGDGSLQNANWSVGGGPIGVVDEVVSWLTETETETGLFLTLHYREE